MRQICVKKLAPSVAGVCGVQLDRTHLLVVGGLNQRLRYNDVWILDLDDKAWTQVPFPLGVCFPTCARSVYPRA